ncbi:hypothetical protein PTSG_06915 [Salpingoeca rosetta]|uniref:Condensin complex subunit 1 n=1 Tax=Salpingoeca rosetta (strain ATCC 50818 / BSB-021) TaxID=946362 RepID=F2UF62_SALR5|nr:uncharacterized protein PTSG_06915 [Salpingoeca rosetta]EGD75262.1 hypothetical protein PTSG_06915 [Salpingoeca rosetta]|eukprot:XP_004992315.1 hypothetical protein PTSG_06915 [Salpingoeca rosetta]
MKVDFQIPADADDLLATDANVFSVATFSDVRRISEYNLNDMIADATKTFKDGTEISYNSTFDVFFSLARFFGDLSPTVQKATCSSLLSGMQWFGRTLQSRLPEMNSNSSEAQLGRNCLKMYTYLISLIASHQEGEAVKPTQHLGGATKKTKKTKSEFSWSQERERLLAMMLSLLQLDVPKLWPMSCPEEQFVNLITRFAYVALENPEVVKDKDVMHLLTSILGLMVQKYNHSLGASTAIVHLLPHFEHLSHPLASMLAAFAHDFDSPAVVTDVLREIAKMDNSDFVRDASGSRYFASFLAELATLVPELVLPSLSLLLPHLDGEAYPIRNALLKMIGAILTTQLRADLTPNMAATRDELIAILEERLVDVSAYVRKQALQVWQQLAREKAIPLKQLQQIVPACLQRLEDKSSLVRKQAIAFMTTIMRCNPYGDRLDSSSFAATLAEEEAKLKALMVDAGLPVDDAGTTTTTTSKNNDDSNDEADAENKVKAEEENEVDDLIQDSDTGEQSDVEAAEDSTVADEAARTNADGNDDIKEESAELKQQRVITAYLRDAAAFSRALDAAVPLVTQLLGSTTTTDVTEAIQCLVVATEFKVCAADAGVRKMLVLVWSKDAPVKQAVLDAYRQLFFKPDPALFKTKKAQHGMVAKSLMRLTQNATLADLSSLQELVCIMIAEKELDDGVLKQLWDVVAQRVPNMTVAHVQQAVIVLGMAGKAMPDMIKDNVGLLVATGTGPLAQETLLLTRDVCIALQKLPGSKRITSRTKPQRFPRDHAMFASFLAVIKNAVTSPIEGFIPAAEQMVNMVFKMAEQPDVLLTPFLKEMTECVMAAPRDGGGGAVDMTTRLTRLMFVLGHVAVKQLVHADYVLLELKRRRMRQEEVDAAHKSKAKTNKQKDEEDDEMGVGGASAEDLEAEFIHDVCERELVLGNTLLTSYGSLIVSVCVAPHVFHNAHLQAAAVLALTKFMCISSQFCDSHLQLLFTILKSSQYPQARCNAIIALGDLAFRFPNLIEPWTDHLYARLKDENQQVRLNAVMVLTHLILNDMVKVKGQISNLAVCLEDNCTRIADLARLFFSELSNKGNAIYNVMPDVISHVSHEEEVTPEKMKSIMTFLFSFIKKDRHAESLVDKLCQRFRTTHEVSHWRGFAFCLSLINYSDRCLKKLNDQFACYHDKLGDEAIYSSFQDIIGKASKFAKPETKELVAVLEQRINKCHEQGAEGATIAANAAKAKKKTGSKRSSGRGRSSASVSSSTGDEDPAMHDTDDTENRVTRGGGKRSCAGRKKAAANSKKGRGKATAKQQQQKQKRKATRKHGIRSSQLEDSDDSEGDGDVSDFEVSGDDFSDSNAAAVDMLLDESDDEEEDVNVSRVDRKRKTVKSRRQRALRLIQEEEEEELGGEEDVLLA